MGLAMPGGRGEPPTTTPQGGGGGTARAPEHVSLYSDVAVVCGLCSKTWKIWKLRHENGPSLTGFQKNSEK